jgi:hypothetical protein
MTPEVARLELKGSWPTNEAARRAVNGILEASGSSADAPFMARKSVPAL